MSIQVLMKRAFDLTLAIVASLLLLLPFIIVGLGVLLTSKGPMIYWSDRVGMHNKIFSMPKFRSMKVGTPSVATHLLQDPDSSLTSLGRLLRKTSLDEIPQLWSIIKGDMSFVGPRPALYNQTDLVSLRSQHGLDLLKPGLTGWAQINGRDSISIADKVDLDIEYKQRQSFGFDLFIIWKTFSIVVKRSSISH